MGDLGRRWLSQPGRIVNRWLISWPNGTCVLDCTTGELQYEVERLLPKVLPIDRGFMFLERVSK